MSSRTNYDGPDEFSPGISAVFALGLGVFGMFTGMNQRWYASPIAEHGSGGDVGSKLALAFSALSYLCSRIFGRQRAFSTTIPTETARRVYINMIFQWAGCPTCAQTSEVKRDLEYLEGKLAMAPPYGAISEILHGGGSVLQVKYLERVREHYYVGWTWKCENYPRCA
ncbi:hypothetical protein BJX76DRAFT_221178 [Aspergillus varians]